MIALWDTTGGLAAAQRTNLLQPWFLLSLATIAGLPRGEIHLGRRIPATIECGAYLDGEIDTGRRLRAEVQVEPAEAHR